MMTPYLPYIGGSEGIYMVHHKQQSQQGLHFSPHSTAKTNNKSNSLGKMVSSGISDVVIASVHSEENLSEEVDDENDYYYSK